jgi:leucyl-tRNA synthetase
MVNSGPFTGMPSGEAGGAIVRALQDKDLAEPQVQYRLRDWCISRQRYWGPPIPMIHCPTCGIVPVPEQDLPVLLPEGGDFRDAGIVGVHRFLERVWRWYTEELPGHPAGDLPREGQILLHRTIQRVTRDLETLSYNTAVAALMACHKALRRYPLRDRYAAESFVVLLSPFAPHLAEELWERLGRPPSVIDTRWPAFDPGLTVEDHVEIAVQVNGRLRETVVVPRDSTEEAVRQAALATERIRTHTRGNALRKVYFVPNRLINLIVG